MTGLVVHSGLDKGNFVAVWVLGTIHAFLPNLLGQLILSRFNIIAFGKKARLIRERKEHRHPALNALFFQMLHQLPTNTAAFMLRTNGWQKFAA